MREHRHAHGDSHEGSDAPARSRRFVLAASAGLASASLAGCLGGGGGGNGDSGGAETADAPRPITLSTDHTCDVCGMVIPQHPGPSAEVFYGEHRPDDHDNPARFDSTWEAYKFDFARQREGWSAEAFYVTDYSAVEYTISTEGGDKLISTHPEAEAFASAENVVYVVGSEVKGAMGKDLIGFTDADEAKAFQDDHGGELMSHDAVAEETVGRLGMS